MSITIEIVKTKQELIDIISQHVDLNEWNPEDFKIEQINPIFNPTKLWVITKVDGEFAGLSLFEYYTAQTAFCHGYVAKKFRGNSVHLTAALKEFLIKTKLFTKLLALVSETKPIAIAYLRKFGFQEITKIKNVFKNNTNSDAILLELDLWPAD